MAFVYVCGKSPALAARWLDLEAGGQRVCLLADAADFETAKTVAHGRTCIDGIFVLPAPDASLDPLLSARVDAESETGVVLPISWEVAPSRFIEGTHVPQIVSYYPLFERLWHAGFRAFTTYNLSGQQTLRVPLLLDAFRGKHAGQRCFVVGNGPSLNRIDMGRLKNEITFGANRCYLGFAQWGFSFTYWGVTDWLQIEEYGREYEQHVPPEIPAFFPFEYLAWLRFANACPVDFRYRRNLHFSDTGEGLGFGNTVTYALLQIAAAMGCDPIILVGVDHRYDLAPVPLWRRGVKRMRDLAVSQFRGTPLYKAAQVWRQAHRESRTGKTATPRVYWQGKDAAAPTHFHAGYATGEQKRFLMPSLADSERAFRFAAQWARGKGVRILNATPDSALDAFPRVRFEDLF